MDREMSRQDADGVPVPPMTPRFAAFLESLVDALQVERLHGARLGKLIAQHLPADMAQEAHAVMPGLFLEHAFQEAIAIRPDATRMQQICTALVATMPQTQQPDKNIGMTRADTDSDRKSLCQRMVDERLGAGRGRESARRARAIARCVVGDEWRELGWKALDTSMQAGRTATARLRFAELVANEFELIAGFDRDMSARYRDELARRAGISSPQLSGYRMVGPSEYLPEERVRLHFGLIPDSHKEAALAELLDKVKPEIARELITEHGFTGRPVNDWRGLETSLLAQAMRLPRAEDQLEMVRFLVGRGADPRQSDDTLRSLLDFVWIGGEPGGGEDLLGWALQRKGLLAEALEKSGNASAYAGLLLREKPGRTESLVQELLMADPVYACGAMKYLAVSVGQEAAGAMRVAVKAGLRVNGPVSSEDSRSALHLAATVELTSCLLALGADANATDGLGNTPGHELILDLAPILSVRSSEFLARAMLLVRAGADLDIRNKAGVSVRQAWMNSPYGPAAVSYAEALNAAQPADKHAARRRTAPQA